MNMVIRLYRLLSKVSEWVESRRVNLLARIYGIASDVKPPVPWREREGLPDHNHWPEAVQSKDGLFKYPVLLTGKTKVGPVRPVPAALEMDTYVSPKPIETEEEAKELLRRYLKKGSSNV